MLAASTASARPSDTPLGQMLEGADAATAGDHRDAHRVGHRAREGEIEAALGAVAVHAGEQDLARPERLDLARPLDGVQAGVLAPAVVNTSHLPGAVCLASIATTMHWLPTLLAASRTSCGLFTAAVFMLTLSAPALSSRRTSSTTRTPPDGERDEDLLGHLLDHVQDDVARRSSR